MPDEILKEKNNIRRLIRNFIIELLVYGVLVVFYFYLVLQFLGGFLEDLFKTNLITYAFLGLGLIVAQGVVLDLITTFLLDQIKLERLE